MESMDRMPQYKQNSLSLVGAIALGTGVMIGAGIFALTGQMAEMTGALFPLAFLSAALIVSFSAYSYVKLSNAYPSAGGIGMYLHKAYGPTLATAFHALLMYFSMVIAQSFLARTFGSYTLELFDVGDRSLLVPLLGVALIISAFLLNLSANKMIQGVASVLGFIKIGGIILFGVGGVIVADSVGMETSASAPGASLSGFLGATALGVLAFKGFTTITNSGSEIKDPHRNVGRAIMISIGVCVVIYALVGFAVASNLSLTEMKLVPHRHFLMPGSIQKHTLVYTVVLGLILTAFFDLSRIAALGIIFYLIMDIAIHWGVLRHLREEINANATVLVIAILLDAVVLAGFLWVKATTDPLVLVVASVVMAAILLAERLFLSRNGGSSSSDDTHSH